jgi:hypothetical protein
MDRAVAMTTPAPQDGDRRFMRAATDDGYWVQEYDAVRRIWRYVKFVRHVDEDEA